MGDVRARRELSRQREETALERDRQAGESMSFHEKMRFFAQQMGDKLPLAQRPKLPSSPAQLQIEQRLAAQGFLVKDP